MDNPAPAPANEPLAKRVAIYTTPTCGYCKMAKEFFKEEGIAYDEYDVAVDAQKRQEMFDRTQQMGVPVISVDSQFIVGFDKAKIQELLAKQPAAANEELSQSDDMQQAA